MAVLLLCLLVLAGPSMGAPTGNGVGDPEPVPIGSSLRDFDQVLAEAKTRYFQGDVDGARDMLLGLWLRLQSGERVELGPAAEAMVYLGEIQHEAGDRGAAEASFRWVLEQDLDYPVSPFHHPIEVVHLFDYVRQSVRSERVAVTPPPDPVPAPPKPLPLWGYAPFGIPQFNQSQTGRGFLYGGLQVGFGVTSLAMWVHLQSVNTPLHNAKLSDDEVFRYVEQRRYLVQVPASAAFYLSWLASYVDGRSRWRKPKAATGPAAGIAIGIAPAPGGGTLRLGWRL